MKTEREMTVRTFYADDAIYSIFAKMCKIKNKNASATLNELIVTYVESNPGMLRYIKESEESEAKLKSEYTHLFEEKKSDKNEK